MPSPETIITYAISAVSFLLGLCAMVLFGPGLERLIGGEFFGSIVGGLISGVVVIVALGVQFKKQAADQTVEQKNLRKALYAEAHALLVLTYDEGTFWQSISREQSLRYHKRLKEQIQCGVLDANLYAISKIPIEAADSLITMRARLLLIKEAISSHFDFLDDWWGHRITDLTESDAFDAAFQQIQTIHDLFINAALAARASKNRLDADGSFEKQRQQSFSAAQWIEEQNILTTINTALDVYLN